jgi:hypothetical protein
MQIETISLILGIVGIAIGTLVSYYFYRRSLKEKAPYWAITSNNLVEGFSSKIHDLQASYEGKRVQNLTISRVLFWNDGAETIKRDDIETINHVRISPKNDILLLDAKVLASNNNSSQFTVQIAENDNCIYLNFDYLDEKQGAVIQIIHTGTSSQDLEVIGDIKGAKNIHQRSLVPKWAKIIRNLRSNFRMSRKTVAVAGIVSGFLYILGGVLGVIYSKSLNLFTSPRPVNTLWFQLSIAIFLLLGGVLLVFTSVSLLRVSKIAPKGLEIFDKD